MVTTIGVIGSAVPSALDYEAAVEVGAEIARQGCVLVCGGLTGVMEAACKGAKSEGGTTIGIIPGDNRSTANRYVDIPIVTNMGYARNLLVVSSSQAIVAIAGGWGTLSEIAFALKFGIPIVGVNTWDVSTEIISTSNPIEAVMGACQLAKGPGVGNATA